ncbi:RNA polymerase-binding protein DksA [Deltaproteobacteria bacterium TL4]
MDGVEPEFFRAQLLQMKSRILGETVSTVHDMQNESTLFPDPTDRASLESEHITSLRIRDRERKLLGKIDEALDRIDNGSFGQCEECGEPISTERLMIRPVTTYCISCKNEQEAFEKRSK